MEKDRKKIWSIALGELEVVISKANFQTWFSGTFIFEFKNGILTVGVRSIFIEDYLKKHYIKDIKSAVEKQLSEPIKEIKFKVASELGKDQIKDRKTKVIHNPVDNSDTFSHSGQPVDNSQNKDLKISYAF
ncbi:hypothetical protein COT12_00295, partial [Candidatus Berkelbacteria bacterium CG08_land_8_20_14_0_20_39_8]